MLKSRPALLLFAATLLAVAACSDVTSAPPSVVFSVDAVFCGGSPFRYELLIDGAVVADTVLVHRQLSKPFPVAPGQHRAGGRLYHYTNLLVDTVFTVPAGGAATVTVPLYCS